MYISLLGWLATIILLAGYILNSSNKRMAAFIAWIIGDILWIIYDYHITNWSHLSLSTIIIFINVYGIIFNKENIFKKPEE